jgi:NDP-sugar pyrophosphorylase family protein
MKAVVLVGGEGTRLRPLTETIPKPLLPFMNRPFLDRVLDHLAAHGIEEVVCSSPYLEAVFHAFLESRRDRPPTVTWITEDVPLGTAGAIAGARDRLEGTFVAMNGDVLTDIDIGELVAFHRDRGATATIALTPVDDARPFGLVETGPDGRVVAFREKPAEPIPGAINAGVYVLDPEALDDVPPGVMVSIERETYPGLISRGAPVFASVSSSYWRDVGTPAAYLQAHVDALDGLIAGYEDAPRPYLDDRANVATRAEVGPHVVVGAEAVIGPGSRVERAVLHRGAEVQKGAVVEGAILGPGAVVGAAGTVRDCVLAEGARVPPGGHLEGGGVRPGEVATAGAGG